MTRTEAMALAAEMVQECEDFMSSPTRTSLSFLALDEDDVVQLRDALLALTTGAQDDPS